MASRITRRVVSAPLACWFAAVVLGIAAAAPAQPSPPTVATADWPQWRGPKRDGVSTEAGALGDLTKPLAKKWARDVGAGYASVAVRGGRLYTMGWQNDRDTVWCLDAATGEPVWSRSYPAKKHAHMHEGGPAATPAVSDRFVFTQDRAGGVLCLDVKSGEPVWSRDLAKDSGVRPPEWAFAGSPLLLDHAVIVDLGRTVALDPATGKTIWETKDYGAAYSSPAPFTSGGRELLAVFNKPGLAILDPANQGREVAQFGWETQYGVNAATPAVSGDLILITSGYNRGAGVVRFDGTKLERVWQNKDLGSQVSSPVILGEQAYGFDEAVFRCIDLATGNVRWSERGLGEGAVTAAGGKLVILGKRGELVIAEASADGFKPITRTAAITDGAPVWTAPVAVGGRIYCRGGKGQLVCLEAGGS